MIDLSFQFLMAGIASGTVLGLIAVTIRAVLAALNNIAQ